MNSLRQLSGGIIIGLVSVILVVGGIFLSIAETFRDSVPTPTQIPPTFPLSFPTPTPSPASAQSAQSAQSETPTVTLTAIPLLPSATSLVPPTICTPPSGWNQITLAAGDTIYSIAQRYRTTTENLSAANCLTSLDLPAGYVLLVPPIPATVTAIPCGPFAGWVRAYTVQPGDNLFRISLSYGTTVPHLQRANCLGTSTTIFTGQRLWVPNVPTLTPGITNIPNFPTATNTLQPTSTIEPPTSTELPTATASLAPTTAPTATPTVNAPASTSSSPASP